MALFLEDPRVLLLMDHHSNQPLDPNTCVEDLEAWQRDRQHFQSLGLQHQVGTHVFAFCQAFLHVYMCRQRLAASSTAFLISIHRDHAVWLPQASCL